MTVSLRVLSLTVGVTLAIIGCQDGAGLEPRPTNPEPEPVKAAALEVKVIAPVEKPVEKPVEDEYANWTPEDHRFKRQILELIGLNDARFADGVDSRSPEEKAHLYYMTLWGYIDIVKRVNAHTGPIDDYVRRCVETARGQIPIMQRYVVAERKYLKGPDYNALPSLLSWTQ